MNGRTSDYLPYAASALAGLIVCLGVTIATGRNEAWDSGSYFSLGIPLMCAAIFALAYRFPVRAWRWTLSMAVGQSLALLLGGGSLSLWPLSIAALTICSLPQFVAGRIASRLGAKNQRA